MDIRNEFFLGSFFQYKRVASIHMNKQRFDLFCRPALFWFGTPKYKVETEFGDMVKNDLLHVILDIFISNLKEKKRAQFSRKHGP